MEKKFENIKDVEDWEILTDNGYKPIKRVGKTVPYEVYTVKTNSGISIRCADTHILFKSDYDMFTGYYTEAYAKDIRRGDYVVTKNGSEQVVSVSKTKKKENMYDIEVDSDTHSYYANGFLSHNSIFLCNDAANFIKAGKNVVFVTCEMSDKKVVKRIGANLLDIDISKYDEIARDPDEMLKRITRFRQSQLTPLGKLFIKEYPTSCCTSIDLENYIKQIEETKGFKIHVVVVDYINIMKNYRSKESANTYINIKNLAEDLRAIAVKRNCLIVTATQSNRSAFDSTDITLSQIAESMGLVATADDVFGIIQDSEQNANYEYFLKFLKVRDGHGKNSKMKMLIDYPKMRLTEEGTIIQEDGTQTGISTAAAKPRTAAKAKERAKTESEKIRPNKNFEKDENFGTVFANTESLRDIRKNAPTQEDMDF